MYAAAGAPTTTVLGRFWAKSPDGLPLHYNLGDVVVNATLANTTLFIFDEHVPKLVVASPLLAYTIYNVTLWASDNRSTCILAGMTRPRNAPCVSKLIVGLQEDYWKVEGH